MKIRILMVMSLLILGSANANAENVFKIEIGRDYKGYSQSDMQRRIWDLENAVMQLQARVFQLESSPVTVEVSPPWVCTISAMGNKYTAVGESKPVAEAKVTEKCQRGEKDGFFCNHPRCDQ